MMRDDYRDFCVIIQGNPKPWKRAGVSSRYKGKDGKMHTRDFPIHFDRTDKTWTQIVHTTCVENRPDELFEGPLEVKMEFRLLRPKSLPKKVNFHIKKPDIDNLAKGIKDIMSGIIYRDDNQIVQGIYRKEYTNHWPGVTITIRRLK